MIPTIDYGELASPLAAELMVLMCMANYGYLSDLWYEPEAKEITEGGKEG